MLSLVIVGAFVGFSSSSTFIDFDQKRVKFSNNIFGLIRTGKWMAIEPNMKIGLNISNQVWNTMPWLVVHRQRISKFKNTETKENH